MQTQEALWGLLTSQTSQIGELQIQQETLHIVLTEEDIQSDLSSTHTCTRCRHILYQKYIPWVDMPHLFIPSSINGYLLFLSFGWYAAMNTPVQVFLMPVYNSFDCILQLGTASHPVVTRLYLVTSPHPSLQMKSHIIKLVSYFGCILGLAPWGFTNTSAWSHP